MRERRGKKGFKRGLHFKINLGNGRKEKDMKG